GAMTRACSQSRNVPTGTRKRRANSACDSPSLVRVIRISRARRPRSSPPAVTSRSSGSVGSAGITIRPFFTLVAPSDRDEARRLTTSDKDGGEELAFYHPNHLEALLLVMKRGW